MGAGVALGLGVAVGVGEAMASGAGVADGEGDTKSRSTKFLPFLKTAKPSKPITRTVSKPTINDFMSYIIQQRVKSCKVLARVRSTIAQKPAINSC